MPKPIPVTENQGTTQVVSNEENGAFISAATLRSAHADLLKRYRSQNMAESLAVDAAHFLARASATGAVLDDEETRWDAQSALDYWAALLYRHGQPVHDAVLQEFDPELAPALPDRACPYLGLQAFEEQHSGFFFGRDLLVHEALERLEAQRLLAVTGPSGSGKSSLVLAGLIPALRKGVLAGSENWRILPRMVPGAHPLRNLARLLTTADVTPSSITIDDTAVRLLEDPEILPTLFSGANTSPILLVIDQFEELFSLCADNQERQAFVTSLLAFKDKSNQHYLALTIRTDFEPFLVRYSELHARFQAAQVRMTPLTAAELRRAIEMPAEQVGLRFEAGVVDALLQDIVGEPAALPLLQFTLRALWERRQRNRITWEAYQASGGGRNALAVAADQFYNNLIPEDQVTARRILLQLVQPGTGLEVTSGRVSVADLLNLGEDPGRVKRVLEHLLKARLLKQSDGDVAADRQVEVAHEALIRNWPTLVEWLDKERENMRHRLRLKDAAQRWLQRGKESDALLRGSLLDETLMLDGLIGIEKEYVEESLFARAKAKLDSAVVKQRELNFIQALADAEAKTAKRLRRFAVAQIAATVIMILGLPLVFFPNEIILAVGAFLVLIGIFIILVIGLVLLALLIVNRRYILGESVRQVD